MPSHFTQGADRTGRNCRHRWASDPWLTYVLEILECILQMANTQATLGAFDKAYSIYNCSLGLGLGWTWLDQMCSYDALSRSQE